MVIIDQKVTLENRKRTSTIDIPGTEANKDAKDLGFELVENKVFQLYTIGY